MAKGPGQLALSRPISPYLALTRPPGSTRQGQQSLGDKGNDAEHEETVQPIASAVVIELDDSEMSVASENDSITC